MSEWKAVGTRAKRVDGKTVLVPMTWQRGKQVIIEQNDLFILSIGGREYTYVGTYPTLETAQEAAENFLPAGLDRSGV